MEQKNDDNLIEKDNSGESDVKLSELLLIDDPSSKIEDWVIRGLLTNEEGIRYCEYFLKYKKSSRYFSEFTIDSQTLQIRTEEHRVNQGKENIKSLIVQLNREIENNKSAVSCKINFHGVVKELLAWLEEQGINDKIDHLTDKQIAELFLTKGKVVNANSLKTIRNRDLSTSS